MKRHQQILAAVLLLQVILTVIVFWPQPAVTGKGELLFPNLTAAEIVSLEIADEQGNRLALSKGTAGWVLPEADDYPVQNSVITPVLESLVSLDTGNLVAQSAAAQQQLQVAEDDFVRRLIWQTAEGNAYLIYLGSAPRYTATHFRVEGQDETYLTEDLSSWQLRTEVASWVETSYLDLLANELTSVTLENSNGIFNFSQDEAGAWTLDDLAADETVNASQIAELVRKSSFVSLQQPLGKSAEANYGMADPSAVIILRDAEGEHTLTIGAHWADKQSYVLKASDSEYYVTGSDMLLQPLVESAREDFLQLEPATEE